jgi:UDP-glucose 4-epimerase
MRCLVTGASGFIGSHLTRLLVEEGHIVTAMVRPSSDLCRLNGVVGCIDLLRADLDDVDSAEAGIIGAAPETVFHLAWAGITSDTRNLATNIDTSLKGSLKLFRIAQQGGCRCWVGLGSQAEFGPSQEVLRDGLTLLPDTPYGAAKLQLSTSLEALAETAGIRFVWLRLLSAYGPGDDSRHLIPALMAHLLAGRKPSLTSGLQQWDYLYIDDAVEAIYRAAVVPGVRGKYVLASGRSSSIRSVAEQLRDMIDPALPIEFGEAVPSSLRADVTAFRKATGWQPRTDLCLGLRKTLDWRLEHRAADLEN